MRPRMSFSVIRWGRASFSGGLDLAPVLAQLRLDVGKSQHPEEIGLARDRAGASFPRARTRSDSIPAPERAGAYADVVGDVSGEVVEGERELAAAVTSRRSTASPLGSRTEVLVSPLPIEGRVGDELQIGLRDRCSGFSVATRRSTSFTVSTQRRRLPPTSACSTSGMRRQLRPGDPRRSASPRRPDAGPRPRFDERDALEDLLLGLLPESRQGADFPSLGGALQLREGRDLEGSCPGREPSSRRDPGRGSCRGTRGRRIGELLVELHVSGLPELGDVPRDGIADPVHLDQGPLLDERAEILGESIDRAGRVLVGANLERIVALQLEEDSRSPPGSRATSRLSTGRYAGGRLRQDLREGGGRKSLHRSGASARCAARRASSRGRRPGRGPSCRSRRGPARDRGGCIRGGKLR